MRRRPDVRDATKPGRAHVGPRAAARLAGGAGELGQSASATYLIGGPRDARVGSGCQNAVHHSSLQHPGALGHVGVVALKLLAWARVSLSVGGLEQFKVEPAWQVRTCDLGELAAQQASVRRAQFEGGLASEVDRPGWLGRSRGERTG